MRVFVLRRNQDISGVSGTGVVAEGIEFSDGKVALRWVVKDHRSTVTWDNIDSVEAVHGHEGATLIEWITPEDPYLPINDEYIETLKISDGHGCVTVKCGVDCGLHFVAPGETYCEFCTPNE